MSRRATDWRRVRGVAVIVFIAAQAHPATGAELKPQTVAAFDRYAQVSESVMEETKADPTRFLWVDRLADDARRRRLDELGRGGLVIERVTTRDDGRSIDIPSGLVHHWVGMVFVPGVRVDEAVALLQDYDRHAEVYRPAVARSRLVERTGDRFRVELRFFMKKGITVVVNSEHEARFNRPDPSRAMSRIVSTRIAEVENPDTPRETEKSVGNDGGYLWRLNSYWRFQERDGGTYIECESISLTRRIPTGLGWLVGPFVNSLPRESLTFTLETTRHALTPAPVARR